MEGLIVDVKKAREIEKKAERVQKSPQKVQGP